MLNTLKFLNLQKAFDESECMHYSLLNFYPFPPIDQHCLSLFNPNGEISSEYPSSINDCNRLSLPILIQKQAQSCGMMFITCQMVVAMGSEIPGTHFQYQDKIYPE